MRVAALLPLLTLLAAPVQAQNVAQADTAKAARCAELVALWDRYGARRGEGSTPNLDRAIAGQDCQDGRYDRGIKTLEDMLRRARITVPPG